MAKKKNKRENDGAALDMTPMIDVVFQLIIFFVVTLKTADSLNPDIVLEYGKDGPELKLDDFAIPPVTIEVKRYPMLKGLPKFVQPGTNGRIISVSGSIVSESQLKAMLRTISKSRGTNFPVLIRGDKDVPHSDIRTVMNICNEVGIWKVSFVAMIQPGDSK